MGGSWLINCFLSDALAADLSMAIRRALSGTSEPVMETRMRDLPVPVPDGVSRLILSGSEASVLDDHPWHRPLADLVRSWVESGRPMLGICYGHQFLAATLAGRDAVRRAMEPEFGWTDICLRPSDLWPVGGTVTAMVSHYDEVADLPPEFTVLATSSRCAVHGMQFMDWPVYGIQFHPEYGRGEAERIFDRLRTRDPAAMKWFLEPAGSIPEEGLQGLLQRFAAIPVAD